MLMMTHLVSSARVTLLSPAQSGAGAEWRQHSEADLATSSPCGVYCHYTIYCPPLPGAEQPLLLGPEQRHRQGLLLVPGPGPQVSADQLLVIRPSDLCLDCL